MIKIGITGGIASGKTTICKYLEELGYSVYYSDPAAIYLAEHNDQLKSILIKEFGKESYLPDGKYNRAYIGGIVFKAIDRLNTINEIFRIFLLEDFKSYCVNKEVIFYESALIFEHGLSHQFDYIISAYAPVEIIKERLTKRNFFTSEEINNRLNSQMDPVMKSMKSDYIINTYSDDYLSRLSDVLDIILPKPH
jgi:dephospho-CoA kinase